MPITLWIWTRLRGKKLADKSLLKGRVIEVQRSHYTVIVEKKHYVAHVSGRYTYMVVNDRDYPVVGDYVMVRLVDNDQAIIEQCLTRQTVISRQSVKQTKHEQVLVANVNIVFICVSLNKDFNVKKIERLVSMASYPNIETHLVLTKKDLVDDLDVYQKQLSTLDVPVHFISAFNQKDIEQMMKIIDDKTAVCIGASGVGKSTFINKLIDKPYFDTNDIRVSDAQGHHTTTHRELVYLKTGGSIIDTPGIRIMTSYIMDDVDSRFKSIHTLAKKCRFRDCTHTHEPGCAVLDGLMDGDISDSEFDEYKRVIRYNKYLKKREEERLRKEDKK
jgi:ribosome biogenesis GTPase